MCVSVGLLFQFFIVSGWLHSLCFLSFGTCSKIVFQIKFLAYNFFLNTVTHAIQIADIQAPRTSKGVLRSGRSFSKDSPMGHWQSIIESLNTILCTMKENFVRN
jgi:hypothetical protein